jgi:hypothetical protein
MKNANSTRRIVTVNDVRYADLMRKAVIDDRHAAKAAKVAARHFVPANLHPAIGVLQNARGVKFYAFVNGFYTVGSVDALTAKLAQVAQ